MFSVGRHLYADCGVGMLKSSKALKLLRSEQPRYRQRGIPSSAHVPTRPEIFGLNLEACFLSKSSDLVSLRKLL